MINAAVIGLGRWGKAIMHTIYNELADVHLCAVLKRDPQVYPVDGVSPKTVVTGSVRRLPPVRDGDCRADYNLTRGTLQDLASRRRAMSYAMERLTSRGFGGIRGELQRHEPR